jgi:hypothetical protein
MAFSGGGVPLPGMVRGHPRRTERREEERRKSVWNCRINVLFSTSD